MGGLLLTGAAFGQNAPPSPFANDPQACPVVGPNGQVMNPRKKELSHLPPKRLGWDGIEVRMANPAEPRLQRPTPKELALKNPECEIVEILNLDMGHLAQEMVGFGGTLMDSDVWNLMRLSPEKRHAAIVALAGKDGLGFNIMRIGFGSSDWNRDANFYTYCDVPTGETDRKLMRFSIQKDIDRGIVDVVREFRAVNPDLQILASVWGLPAWMKLNKSIMHGFFDSKFAGVYADYLVKCVQAWEKLGIPIHYLTTQNEPATADDRDTPATMWTWEQQRDITLALAERFTRNKIETKIWLMDHNFDMAQNFAKPLLDDPRVKKAVSMVAFHDYRGRPEEMGVLARQHPDMPAFMTERSYGALTGQRRLMDIFMNGGTGQISWTTVTDEAGGPAQHAGFRNRAATAPSTNFEKLSRIMVVPRTEDPPSAHLGATYFTCQTFTPLIMRGARRITTNPLTRVDTGNAAFRNPDGSVVMVMVNAGSDGFDMAVQRGEAALVMNMPANSIVSLRFGK